MKSYFSRYVKSYAWQTLSLLISFLSMFIVTPMLTSNPVIYGIYILCISSHIFLAYADLGFVGAGFKYASESYARGEPEKVVEIVGFVAAILLSFVALFAGVMVLFAFRPELIVHGISTGEQMRIARNLFLTLAVFSPAIVLQRGLQIIYGVRIEQYIQQRTQMAGNLVKIASVFLVFFRKGRYDISGYYLFSQSIVLAVAFLNTGIASRRYGFSIRSFLKSIRFSSALFVRMRALAFSSLVSVASWVVFYELDPFAVSKLLGADKLAIYAIALSLMTFVRNLYGILFSPFSARLNHFVGLGDQEGLRRFYGRLIALTLPVAILPLVSLESYLPVFIGSWVGSAYELSVQIARVLLASYVFSFVSYPTGILLIAQSRIREMNAVSIFSAIVYWALVIPGSSKFGVYSFAVSKTLVFFLLGGYYLVTSVRFIGRDFIVLFRDSFLPLALPLPVIVAVSRALSPLLSSEKGRGNLFIAIAAIAATSAFGFALYVAASPAYRRFAATRFSIMLKKESR